LSVALSDQWSLSKTRSRKAIFLAGYVTQDSWATSGKRIWWETSDCVDEGQQYEPGPIILS